MAKEEAHDVFEGEIPTDLGKKKPKLLIKVVGLLILIAVLGAAAAVLQMEKNESGVMDDTKNAVQDFMTSNMPTTAEPDTDLGQPNTKEVKGTSEPVVSTGSTGQIQIDLSQTKEAGATEAGPAFDGSMSDISIDTLSEESDPITITPPSANMQPTQDVNRDFASRYELSELRERVISIETTEQEQINVIKSGIEMQTMSIERLNNLLQTLDSLKTELAELNSAAAKQPSQREQARPSKPAVNKAKLSPKAKPVEQSFKPELTLLGIDRWGNEKFAQIQHGDQIHLLAKHEELNGWRVTSISEGAIIVINDNGDSFEIKN